MIKLQNIKKAIETANKILVVGHQNPDGDALGSMTAVSEMLQQWQKNHLLFCRTPAPFTYDFLPNINRLTTDETKFIEYNPDLIIVLDSGSLQYAGIDDLIKKLPQSPTIINIDHHITNVKYGNFNIVKSNASSTCEILFYIFKKWNVRFNQQIATSLLNGLMTDTGGLTNPATNSYAFRAASNLMNYGANYKKIIDYNVRTKRINLLNLWGLALERLTYNQKSGAAITYLKQEDFKKLDIDENQLEGLSNFLNSLKDVNYSLLLTEKSNNIIKGSFRTTKDNVDVSAIAKSLGGGGHKKAAGFEIEGKLEIKNGELVIS